MSVGERAVDRSLRQRRERARAAAAAGETAADSIPRRGTAGPARLSFAQERLWFLDRLQPGSAAYNVPVALGLRGALDPAALASALDELFRRQAALRSRMSTIERDGALIPVQESAPPAPVAAPLVDLAALGDEARRAEARRVARAEGRRPFAFEGGPLVRVRRLRLHDAESLLLVVLHHVVADGWSVGLLVRELATLYAAFAAGRRPPFAELPEPPIDYADWAEWQRAWLAGGEGERQLAYWRQRLAGAPPLLELPTDRPRPPVGRQRGDRVLFALDAATQGAVDAAARRLGATSFVVLFAAFQAFLGRLAGVREVVVGTPVANRRRVETEGLIGFFANTLAVRTDLGGEPSFAELVAQVRGGWLDDFEHQDLPFEEVVAALAPPRDMSHAPVFQVLFALQNAPRPAAVDDGLTIVRSEVHSGAAKVDLLLTLSPVADGGLNAALEFDRDLFDRATVERWSRCLATLLAAAVADPETPLADLPLLDAAARREVVVGFQPAPAEYPGPPLVHQLVAEQAAAAPDAPAVRFAGEEISYRQLAGRAGALAAELVRLGVGPEVRVGVAMERSLELPVALLGVLAADGAYVPLDPGYPEERLAHMCADALAGQPAAVLLTQPALAERFAALAPAGTRVIALPPGGAVVSDAVAGDAVAGDEAAVEIRAPRALPESPAYVIYTSGSTGRPKGAANTHRAIRNRLLWMRDAFRLGPGDRVLQKTPYSFDVSVWELFCPLVSGACLVMARPGGHGDAAYLVRAIAEERVTLVHFVPSMLQAFLAEPGVEELDVQGREGEGLGGGWRVAASGEALSPDLVRRFRERLPHVPLHNLYGPTEAAVEVSWWPCQEAAPKVVPIGRPLPNLCLHVVDRRLRPQPVGVAGELLIGGVGLARGYLARPGLTAERWVPDPFVADLRAGSAAELGVAGGAVAGGAVPGGAEPGGRLYRTGDLARWRADGSVEYLGRLDQQVKLRGVRIELGEIETALLGQPQVAAAAAGVREVAPGDARLVAWIVPRQEVTEDGAGDAPAAGAAPAGLAAALRGALRRQLPDAMVPTLFVTLPALPSTPAGKLDRRALPAPDLDRAAPAERWRPPRTPGEELLARVWAEVLHRERVGANDDFFALGGHSLLATQVVARVARAVGVSLPLRQVFETPVLADLAAALDGRLRDEREAAGAAALAPAHEPHAGARSAESAERREEPIPRRAGGGPARLSFAQERLWFLDRLQPGSAAYNVPVVLGLRGRLDPPALQAALDELFRRQPALRTRIATVEGDGGPMPVQEAAPPAPVGLPVVDLGGLGGGRPEPEGAGAAIPVPGMPRRVHPEVRRLAEAEARQPFLLDGGPLVRLRRLVLAPRDSLLLVTLHHAIADGWSVGVLVGELAALYRAFAAGRRPPLAELPEPPIEYADWAEWQRAWLAAGEEERQLAYWRRRLAGAPPLLELPTDRPRPPLERHRGDRVAFGVEAATAVAAEALARRLRATPFMVLLAAFQALLGRLADSRDVVVGTPIANRQRVETERLIGFFANTLALRSELAGDPTFAELVGRVREGVFDDFEHQDLPFEQLVAALAPPRNLSHAPVFQVLFTLQTASGKAPVADGLTFTRGEAFSRTAKFDLSLGLLPLAGGGLAASIELDRDLFDRATVERWGRCFGTLLAAAVADPERRVDDLPLLDAAERREVVAGFQPPPSSYAAPALLHQMVAAQAAATPDAPAVRCEGEEVSYQELSRRAGALAAELARLGVGPEARVGVAMERSVELVVALLGVLGADGAYVPLDPGYPEERLAHMCADALAGQPAAVLLTQPALAERFAALAPAGTRVIALPPGGAVAGEGVAVAGEAADWALPPRALPDSPAYVIYTSGSTGRPKGAANTHRAIRNRLLWMQDAFRLGLGDRVLQKTPYSFDVSVWELFWPLATGACLVVARPGGHGDAAYLVRTIAEERVTVLHFVPSMLQVFLDEPGVGALDGLARVVASGEALPPELVRRFRERLPHAALDNLYGPTEAAVDVSWWPCEETRPQVVPIGRPIANLRLHVVDRHLAPQPIGVPGELLLGGVGLARGYHGRPGLTAERWVPDPFAAELGAAGGAAPGGRLYRTGDLARWRADGSVEYLGRLDHQVKLRGLRIELGEIEAALVRQPQVAAAAAGIHLEAEGGARLVAWIVPRRDAAQTPAEKLAEEAPAELAAALRAALRRELPDGMVPTLFVTLPALPSTPSGKVDRRALPAPEIDGAVAGGRWREPESAAEKLLAEVWAEVLRRERVGAGDDFFALGGHSLLAIQVVSRVARQGGVTLPLRQIFETPVLADLAAVIEERLAPPAHRGDAVAGERPIDRLLRLRRERAREAEASGGLAADAIPRRAGGGPARLSFAQERLWFLDRLQPGSAAYNIPMAFGLRGRLDPPALQAALDELFRRQPALRTRIGTIERDGRLVPVQEAAPPAPVALPVVDLAGLAGASPGPEAAGDRSGRRGGSRLHAEARRLAAAEARRPFVLEGAPLVRLRRLALGPRESLLLVTLHHAIADGWSVGVLVGELSALYAAFAAGRRPPLAELPEPPIEYADWAEWQRAWLAAGEEERQLAYWRQRLAGAPPLLELPTDRPRPPLERHRGDRVAFGVEAATTAAAEALARRLGATPFMLLLAAFQALLGRLADCRDVVVGTPVANRQRMETEGLIGFFANTLAIRTELAGDPTFAELVGRVREGALGDFEHQDLPFEELVAALAPPRDMSHAPVFQVLFALHSAPRPAPVAGELEIVRDEANSRTAKFDLLLAMAPNAAGGLAATLELDRDLFDRATVERWGRCWRTLLAAAVADPARRVDDLPLLDAAERREVVAGFQPPPSSYAAPALLHQMVAAQAAATPDAPAVRCEGEEVSYRELSRRAGALSAELVRLGVGPEARVGVAMERSVELVVALLAVLGTDGAYVPLDPGYPEERLAHMCADALAGQPAAVLLTQPALAERFATLAPAGTRMIALPPGGAVAGEGGAVAGEAADWALPPRALPDSPAYVIYTSGSTGRPKGAANTHRAIRNRLLWMQDAFRLGPGDRVLQKTPYSFDVSVWEFFWPLATGACLVVARPGGHGDAAYLVRTIAEERVTVLHFVPSMLQVFLDEPGVGALDGLSRVVASGEALPPELVRRFHERLPHAALDNLYGPTEAAVDVSWWPCEETRPQVVPIGRPIANLRLHVVDRHLAPQPIGVPGELLLGGVGLARGYHGRPGLTAERWVPDPFAAELGAAGGAAPGGRLYRTGDLARWRADGSVEYLGRLDHQVKLRGLRIELGEIEAALAAHPAVREAVTMVRDERLVAFVVAAPEATAPPDDAELRAWLRRRLPEAMVPAAYRRLDAMPLSPNGKADRRALAALPAAAGVPAGATREPQGDAASPVAAGDGSPTGPDGGGAAPPSAALESRLVAVWSGVLERDRVPAGVSFFDLGGHSLQLVEVQRRIRRDLGIELAVVDLFRYPTITALADHLRSLAPPAAAPTAPATPLAAADQALASAPAVAPDNRIAVVGLAGRFPEAPDVEALWGLLAAGREAVRRWTAEELAAAGVDGATLADPAYVPAGVELPDADRFDAALWGISPREAEAIDPQQRVFLETALDALEDAGIDPDRFGGAIGVFAGSGENRNVGRLARRPDLVRALGSYQILLANRSDYLPTRVAYKLGLRGPAVNVQTACSTSLVAVHVACRALLAGDCDAALAGGVSVGEREPRGYLHEAGGIASPDGHTRPFDADARGTVRGHGAGVVVLKRLADALAAGDSVRAVLLGTAINNDGAAKAGFTAPGVEGQAAALAAAHRAAGVEPASLGYVEAHGTGTELGDPIEVAALREAFRRGGGEPERCWIGSVKGNLGHLDAAAGVTGLIKAVLALERETLPPTLHFRRPNPAIDFGPLAVVAEPTPWPRGERPRRAGVSSFGIGGTNAHAVLEEAPPPRPAAARELPGWEVLTLSAATTTAVELASDRLAAWLEARPGLTGEELADVACTLQVGRRHLPWRRVVIARDAAEAAAALRARDPRAVLSGHADGGAPSIAFLLPGQGSQHPGMAAELHAAFPAFRRAFDACAAAHRAATGDDLAALVFATGPAAAERLADTAAAQPALFAVEVALARTLEAAGLAPRALLGHSLGELAAAHLAGVFSLADAAALVAERGRLMAAQPPGDMLAVALPEAELRRRLAAMGSHSGALSLAAVNGVESCVVSGPAAAVAALAAALADDGVDARPLHTSHAFHSPAMAPAVAPFAARVAAVERRPPAVPYLGNLAGGWVGAEEACDPQAWARQILAPVRFADSLAALAAAGPFTLIEVGPGRALSTLARRDPRLAGATVVATQPHPRDPEPPVRALATAVARLWLAGARIEWQALWGGGRRRVRLPGYPFERKSCWVEVPRETAAAEERETAAFAAAAEPDEVSSPAAGGDAIAAGSSAAGPSSAVPGDPLEAALAAAWSDVLGVPDLGVHDNFFDLGGSSLLAVRLGGRLRRETGLEVEPHLLLEHPTVAGLAAYLAALDQGAAAEPGAPSFTTSPDPLLVPLRRDGEATPLVLVHPAGGHVFFYRHLVAGLPPGRPVWGLRALGLEEGEEPLPSVEAMAERYVAALRRLRPRGPYLVGGSSLGGSVAYAMAGFLAAAGEAVPAVVQIDTFGPGQLPAAGVLAAPRADDAGGYELARVEAVARAGTRAMLDYRPPPYAGRLVYFRATLRSAGEPSHPERPWLEVAGGGVDFAVMPGGHLSMHRPPHVERLAVGLASALARAEGVEAAERTARSADEHEIEESCPATSAHLHKKVI